MDANTTVASSKRPDDLAVQSSLSYNGDISTMFLVRLSTVALVLALDILYFSGHLDDTKGAVWRHDYHFFFNVGVFCTTGFH